jgi:hypothetical protein
MTAKRRAKRVREPSVWIVEIKGKPRPDIRVCMDAEQAGQWEADANGSGFSPIFMVEYRRVPTRRKKVKP